MLKQILNINRERSKRKRNTSLYSGKTITPSKAVESPSSFPFAGHLIALLFPTPCAQSSPKFHHVRHPPNQVQPAAKEVVNTDSHRTMTCIRWRWHRYDTCKDSNDPKMVVQVKIMTVLFYNQVLHQVIPPTFDSFKFWLCWCVNWLLLITIHLF